ncbi:MAG: UDP-N-acetylmuramate--L-alanine ligase [Myxococcota bacterium]|nr:UDP-N-acetylmuramate--L-alanine ligase [Myxococcota bacterium]
MFRGKVRQIHFVGIGGIGMSGIAEVLLNLGYSVTGSDMKAGASVRRLRKLGAKVFIGHAPENLGESDVLVKSTAVHMDNPEVQAALDAHVPVIRRAEMLAELMRMKHGLAVAGTHGKTTTTSMLATVAAEAGLDPTVVIGGRLNAIGTNARLGQGEWLVAEADESDGSFLHLDPTVAVVTNIDPEHLEHYGSMETLVDTFVTFANKVPFYGFAVVCLDHPVIQDLLPQLRRRVVTYGLNRQADYRAEELTFQELKTRFSVHRGTEKLGEVELDMPGTHNVQNALATIATAMEMDVPFEVVARGVQSFAGVERRFSVRGEVGQTLVVDDYGHHPVEIAATLEGAEAGFSDRKVVAVFQPHRFTRVRDLHADFCRCFNRADHVVVCPVYAAGESPIEGVDHHSLLDGIKRHGHRSAVAVDSLEDAVAHLREVLDEKAIVITLGAGNVNQVCAELLGES